MGYDEEYNGPNSNRQSPKSISSHFKGGFGDKEEGIPLNSLVGTFQFKSMILAGDCGSPFFTLKYMRLGLPLPFYPRG